MPRSSDRASMQRLIGHLALGPTQLRHVPHLFSLWQSRPTSAEPSFESVKSFLSPLQVQQQCKIKRSRDLDEEIAPVLLDLGTPPHSPASV